MILTCPACTMRYIVSEGSIGPNGRRVRCANCGNQWTQEPEQGLDEELFGEAPAFLENNPPEEEDDMFGTSSYEPPAPSVDDIEDEVDFQSILRKEIESTPIPQGVHPEPEDTVMAQLVKDQKKKKSVKLPPADKVGGYVAATCFYIGILALALVFQPQISRAWPPSNLLYDLVGLKPVMPGEGLALDGLRAEMTDGKITLKGNINNLRETDVKVPSIMASIVDDDGKILDQLLIPPPIARIKPEGSISFDVVYPKIPENATNVTFGFSFIKAEPQTTGDVTKTEGAKTEEATAEKPMAEDNKYQAKSEPEHSTAMPHEAPAPH